MFKETNSSGALIGIMRGSSWTMRGIASVVILTFGSLVTAPAVAAVKQEIKEIQWHKRDATNAAKLSAKVEEAHQALTRLSSRGSKGLDLKASHAQIHALKADLEALDKGAMDDFAANEAHIKAHKLPEIIEQRQQEAVKTYRTRMDTLMAELNAADSAKDAAGFMAHVSKAKANLDKVQIKPVHEKFDPKNLPFSVAKPTGIKPRLSKKDYEARPVAPKKRVQVAANGPLTGIVSAADVTGALPANPSDPSYVAATDDVQITPAIQAKAAALHDDPVQIYNWVHNNVEYIPTYGSIQGSDMTLQTLKGNDFDQASLLIALLRASGIPSRYVYGTIQVPIAQIENWVGGVTDPNAALNLMSQGGIPVTGLTQGGQIKYGQLEHVWVEAWVNFIPSRASKPGTGNTWIALDASFKQYTFTQGAVTQAPGFNASALADQMATTISSDGSNQWIGNIDTNYVQQQTATYLQQTGSFIDGLEAGNVNTTVGDLIGKKSVKTVSPNMLAAGLPYLVSTIGQRMAALPTDLQWKFTYQVLDSTGSAVLTYTGTAPELAGKSFALSFLPASQADAQTALDLLPGVDANGNIDQTQIPNSIPGYLVDVVPKISLGKQVVASGAPYQLGSSLEVSQGYWSPQTGWQLKSSSIVAGEYHAVAASLQGVSTTQISALKNQIQQVDGQIKSDNVTGLDGDDVLGSILQAGLWSYFYLNDNQDWLAQNVSNVVEYPLPSFGTFKLTAQPVYSFGIPLAVEFPGATMDIAYYHSMTVSKDGSQQKAIDYFSATGPRLSALEHQIPEQLFSTITEQVHSISAVAALTIAASQGQRIYEVDSSDSAAVLPVLNVGDDVKEDIANAVSAGLVVTVHQSPIVSAGWQGVGYIIHDPTTGAGAYKISGLANGSGSILGTFGALGVMALFAFMLLSLGVITVLPALLAIVGILWAAHEFANNVEKITNQRGSPDERLLELQQDEFKAEFAGVLALVGLASLSFEEKILKYIAVSLLAAMSYFLMS